MSSKDEEESTHGSVSNSATDEIDITSDIEDFTTNDDDFNQHANKRILSLPTASTVDVVDSLSISSKSAQLDGRDGLIDTTQSLSTFLSTDRSEFFKEFKHDMEISTPSVIQLLNRYQDPTEMPANRITPDTVMITPDMLPLIDISQDDINRVVEQVDGGIANVKDIYGLSSLQDGMLFHYLMTTKGDPYLTLKCMVFNNRDILDRYLGAFQKVIDRHDILRTAIVWEFISSPVQVVLRNATLSVTEIALDPANGAIDEQLMKLFDPRENRISLSEAPLTRFAIAQDIDGHWVAVQLMHHSIDDHFSLELMQIEIKAFLEGQDEALQPPQPFRNFISQALSGPSVEDHERYFTEMLGEIDTPTLPYGISDLHHDRGDITEVHCMVSQDLVIRLRSHAKQMGVSLARMCHLAWAQVVSCTSGQQNVVFGTVISGRSRAGPTSRSLGPLINTLPIRVDLKGASVEECLRQTSSRLTTLLEHQHATLTMAQRCSKVPTGTPLFSAVFNYRRNTEAANSSVLTSGMQVIKMLERTNYPFVMCVDDFGIDIGLTCQVGASIDAMRVCRYMEQALFSLADALDHTPGMPASELEILPAEERELLLQTWNNTKTSYPDHLCVHQIFENQVSNSPDSIALVYKDQKLTYHELNTRAGQLALQLYDLGVNHGDFVAVMLKRSFELIATQLAILKIGAIYVPVDPKTPVDRQVFITNDSAAVLLITDDNMQVPIAIQTPLLRVAFNLMDRMSILDTAKLQKVAVRAQSSFDTAYTLYTSGSTGTPKGVLIPHRGITRLVINNGYADIGAQETVAFAANPSFDASTFEIWIALLNGGRLVIIDGDTFTDSHRLKEALEIYHITTLFLTTALFNQYVASIGSSLAKLKYVFCGGEQESLESFSILLRHGGPQHLIHCYGPTEGTTYATTYEVTDIKRHKDRLPIGRPISNTTVYVLDQQGNPVPLGCEGELYIGGTGVANGYLNRSKLTAERFLPDKFSKENDARMYRTGDLVRYLPDGNLVFVSRNDTQVKIRGFRIELGEIEARLLDHVLVRETIVVALDANGDKRLVAYVVADACDHLPKLMRDHLTLLLPEYMVPSAFVRLDALPVTSNGKVDRRALPEPERNDFANMGYEAPQGEIEIALAVFWSDLLKIERVGRHDDFFMLGGHSLLAIRLINRISTLGMRLPLSTLYLLPRISEIANVLASQVVLESKPFDRITPISRDAALSLSFAQRRMWFLSKIEGASDSYHIPMTIRLQGQLDGDSWQHALNTLFARHDSLRSTFVNVEGQPQVRLLPAENGIPVITHNLRGENDAEARLQEIIRLEASASFDLEKGPLIRSRLIQMTDD
ncbi:hypothetical protein BGZ49_001469, partial [Haplosporangium sp. Z 27]